MANNDTLGTVIAAARKGKGYSQKELAERVDLSPQYLNDIEHDRRMPSSAQFVTQVAKVLSLDAEYLAFLADTWPETLRRQIKSRDDFSKLLTAFRKR
jgi:transcriptional regulator with XRE-family HTH domain